MVGYSLMVLLALNTITSTKAKLKGKYKVQLIKKLCLEADFNATEGTVQEKVICGSTKPVVSEEMMLHGSNPYYIGPDGKVKFEHFLRDVKEACGIELGITKTFDYNKKKNSVEIFDGSKKITMKPGVCK